MTSRDSWFPRLSLTLLAGLVALFLAAPAVAADDDAEEPDGLYYKDPSLRAATARIDSSCRLVQVKIVVPSGRKAVDFEVDALTSGVNCGNGGPLNEKGWGIGSSKTKSGNVYRYYRANLTSEESRTMPLSKLTLNPGTYYLFVDGGKGAKVEIRYRIVP